MKKFYKLYSYDSCLKTINFIKKANCFEVILDTVRYSNKAKIIYQNKSYDVDYCGCQVYIPEQLGSYTAIIYGELPKEILKKEIGGCSFNRNVNINIK
jgi:hypothetical protein